MTKAKVGDRIQIIKPEMAMGEYAKGDEGMVTAAQDKGVLVFFDHYEQGDGSMYVLNEEFVVKEADTAVNLSKESDSAEHIRESILNIQEKRKQLNEEISLLEKQEKELHDALAKKGFVMLSAQAVERYSEEVIEDLPDLDNPDNWKVGDKVKVAVKNDSKYCKFGDVFEVAGKDPVGWIHVNEDSTGNENTINPCILKFHSRPSEA